MFNTQEFAAQLKGLGNAQLKQVAQQYQQDPLRFPLIGNEITERTRVQQAAQAAQAAQAQPQPPVTQQIAQQAQQLPENTGIAQAAPNMAFADGGIVALAGGGMGYDDFYFDPFGYEDATYSVSSEGMSATPGGMQISKAAQYTADVEARKILEGELARVTAAGLPDDILMVKREIARLDKKLGIPPAPAVPQQPPTPPVAGDGAGLVDLAAASAPARDIESEREELQRRMTVARASGNMPERDRIANALAALPPEPSESPRILSPNEIKEKINAYRSSSIDPAILNRLTTPPATPKDSSYPENATKHTLLSPLLSDKSDSSGNFTLDTSESPSKRDPLKRDPFAELRTQILDFETSQTAGAKAMGESKRARMQEEYAAKKALYADNDKYDAETRDTLAKRAAALELKNDEAKAFALINIGLGMASATPRGGGFAGLLATLAEGSKAGIAGYQKDLERIQARKDKIEALVAEQRRLEQSMKLKKGEALIAAKSESAKIDESLQEQINAIGATAMKFNLQVDMGEARERGALERTRTASSSRFNPAADTTRRLTAQLISVDKSLKEKDTLINSGNPTKQREIEKLKRQKNEIMNALNTGSIWGLASPEQNPLN